MTRSFTSDDLDMGDAVLEALRLQTLGDIGGAARYGIAAVKHDPILAIGTMAAFAAHAVRTYADAIGLDPAAAVDRLWTKPTRAGGDRP